MSNCCDDAPKNDTVSEGTSSPKKTVLFYACSGGANVAEVADRVARNFMFEGQGIMFCLAGLGAGIQSMIQTAKDADLNIVLDGCPVKCGKKIFDNAGITNYKSLVVSDLGIEKVKGLSAEQAEIDRVTAKVREMLV